MFTFSACGNKNHGNQSEENWNTVYMAVENVRPTFDELNAKIKEIYNNLSNENIDENLIKLKKIEGLATELKVLTDQNLEILQHKVKTHDTIKIYAIGIKYLNAIKDVEPLMPGMFKKIENDIKGNQTQQNDAIVNAANKITEIGFEYKNLMDSYYDDNKLDVKTGS